MTEFIPISEAKKMRSGINVKAEVKSKGDVRNVNLKSGGTINVCDVIIADAETDDDQMKLTLWGDDIQKVDVGNTVAITNGYANEFKGEISLTKGKFGQMEVNPQ